MMISENATAEVLVVASRAEERSTINNIMIGQGYTSAEVSSLEAARAVLESGWPHLIIVALEGPLDAAMCRHLMHPEDPERSPILIVCDGDARMEWMTGVYGVIDIVRRPFSRSDVLSRCKVLLRIKTLNNQMTLLNNQLLGAQKMECVGALLAGVVHEFNNLMFSVMGFAEMARAGGGTDIDALRESADVSYEVAKRATATAASLLAFSRQATSAKADGDLNDVILAAVRLLQRNMEKGGITIDLQLGELPPTRFAFGPLQQVVLNLMINAWHAMPSGTDERKLTLTSRCEDNHRIHIDVQDTGHGIPQDKMDRIFDAFFTTKKGEAEAGGEPTGSGLGLSIVREVMQDHNGVVLVDSEVGVGTTFTLCLPVEKINGDQAGTPVLFEDGKPETSRKYTVLVVDDEESSRKVLARILLKHGHAAYAASNMAEAVTLLCGRQFDLISLDMIMPDSDGPENVRRLREDGISIPILICTGHVEEPVLQQAMDAGANGLIRKPFSAPEFLARMRECVADG